MNCIKLLIAIIGLSCMTSDALDTGLLINCGLPKSTRSTSPYDGREWQSDDDPAFAPSYLNTVSTTVSVDADDLPYKVGRVFWSEINYTFSVAPGPVFIRLYFFPNVSYNNTLPHQFSTSLFANNFTLLHNFNPSLNSLQETRPQYEFQVILEKGENNLKLTFSPGGIINHTGLSYGYVNGIEIESIPQGLYINESNLMYTFVNDLETGYPLQKDSAAFQTAYRLNVGGQNVDERNDNPGGMKRTWDTDEGYVFGERGMTLEPYPLWDSSKIHSGKKVPAYTAPKIVYGTIRSLGDNTPDINLKRNLTWMFLVDPGFDYVVRLHLCELDLDITGINQRLMTFYINGLLADSDLDIWFDAGGFATPVYKDYVISLPGPITSSKVSLFLDLHPRPDTT